MRVRTEDTILARLQWPSPPADKREARAHRAVLARARRCLYDQAPLTLWGTGFQLLKIAREAEVWTCLETILDEIEESPNHILICMSAPEEDDHSRFLYEMTVHLTLEELITGLTTVADGMEGGIKVTSRMFNPVYRTLSNLTDHVESDNFIKLNKLVKKLDEFDYESDKEKGISLIRQVAKWVGTL